MTSFTTLITIIRAFKFLMLARLYHNLKLFLSTPSSTAPNEFCSQEALYMSFTVDAAAVIAIIIPDLFFTRCAFTLNRKFPSSRQTPNPSWLELQIYSFLLFTLKLILIYSRDLFQQENCLKSILCSLFVKLFPSSRENGGIAVNKVGYRVFIIDTFIRPQRPTC